MAGCCPVLRERCDPHAANDEERRCPGFNHDSDFSSDIRWDEKAGLRRDAVGSQVIDVLLAQEIKETGNEEG